MFRTKFERLREFFSQPKHLAFAISLFLVLTALVLFLSSRPWSLAKEVAALNELEASYDRSYPCHETCLARHLALETILFQGLKDKQPGLEALLKERASRDSIDPNFKRILEKIINYKNYDSPGTVN